MRALCRERRLWSVVRQMCSMARPGVVDPLARDWNNEKRLPRGWSLMLGTVFMLCTEYTYNGWLWAEVIVYPYSLFFFPFTRCVSVPDTFLRVSRPIRILVPHILSFFLFFSLKSWSDGKCVRNNENRNIKRQPEGTTCCNNISTGLSMYGYII